MHVGGDLQRQPRLAESAHAEEGQQARAPRAAASTSSSSRSRPMNDVSCCGRLFGVASSERSGGKFVAQLGMHDLVDRSGDAQSFSRTLPRSCSVTRAGRRVPHCGHGLRNEDLAAVRDAHDPRRAIHRAAEIIVVARAATGADVHTAANRQRMSAVAAGSSRRAGIDHRAEASMESKRPRRGRRPSS